MKRIALAALFALSLPAAASADSWREPRPAPLPPAASSSRDDRQDVRQLDRLMSRYEEAARFKDRRELARLESRLLAAIDEEIAESRRAFRNPGFDRDGYGRDGYGRQDRRRGERGRTELSRLMSLRAEFVDLQGRYGYRATQRKQAVVAEVSRLARADLWRTSSAAPVAWYGRR
jgi:hypothetical protein